MRLLNNIFNPYHCHMSVIKISLLYVEDNENFYESDKNPKS